MCALSSHVRAEHAGTSDRFDHRQHCSFFVGLFSKESGALDALVRRFESTTLPALPPRLATTPITKLRVPIAVLCVVPSIFTYYMAGLVQPSCGNGAHGGVASAEA